MIFSWSNVLHQSGGVFLEATVGLQPDLSKPSVFLYLIVPLKFRWHFLKATTGLWLDLSEPGVFILSYCSTEASLCLKPNLFHLVEKEAIKVCLDYFSSNVCNFWIWYGWLSSLDVLLSFWFCTTFMKFQIC